MVLVCIHVVAYIGFPVIRMVVIMVIAVVIMVIIAMVIMVIIAMVIAVVMVVVVCTAHCCDGDGECFHILCLEFEHVFACFEFVN